MGAGRRVRKGGASGGGKSDIHLDSVGDKAPSPPVRMTIKEKRERQRQLIQLLKQG